MLYHFALTCPNQIVHLIYTIGIVSLAVSSVLCVHGVDGCTGLMVARVDGCTGNGIHYRLVSNQVICMP